MKNKFFPKITAITGGVFTLAICAVMNLKLIPDIEATTEGIRCFDMNFGYSYDTAVRFLELLGENGRHVYLHMQLPLDFIYPLFYALFFVSLIYLLTKDLQSRRKYFISFPLVLAVFDYTENLLTACMLKADTLPRALARTASVFTALKTIWMYLTIILIVILLVRKIYLAKKKKKESQTDSPC